MGQSSAIWSGGSPSPCYRIGHRIRLERGLPGICNLLLIGAVGRAPGAVHHEAVTENQHQHDFCDEPWPVESCLQSTRQLGLDIGRRQCKNPVITAGNVRFPLGSSEIGVPHRSKLISFIGTTGDLIFSQRSPRLATTALFLKRRPFRQHH